MPYPYPYYVAPPEPDKTGKMIAVVVVVIIFLVAVSVVAAGILVVWLQTLPSDGGHEEVETNVGLRAESRGNGNWTISVTSGSKNAVDVRLQVIDPATGSARVSKMVYALLPKFDDPDGVYWDNNQNDKLDAGDTIQLKSSGGHVKAGDKVQLLKGDSVIGTIKELPA
jgi:hypothetical protein